MGARAFNQEYLENPVDEESQIFNPENFVYYVESDLENVTNMKYYAAVDLAMGKSDRGDYMSIITLGKREGSEVCYVVSVIIAKIQTDDHTSVLVHSSLW